MTATFGDFMRPAGQHIAAAVAFRSALPDDVRCEAVRELSRLVSVLARYFADLPLPKVADPAGQHSPSPGTRAVADARAALRRAARSLRHATTITEDSHLAVRHLSAAADYLAAGRDLLQTHFATSPPDTRSGNNSHWAPAVTSGPVTAALLSELAGHARTLAPWAAQLTMTGAIGSGMPAPERLILHSAIGGLWITATAVEAAQRNHPPSEQARRLLAAIPPGFPPPRRPPDDGEPVTELCEGITITAERLRYAARAPAPWPPPMSASWRRDALASAIASHASEIILRTLAERASQLGTDAAIGAQLHTAADAMSLAWPAWRGVACEWDILSTGAHAGPGHTHAADLGDLALRTGRLAYDSPHWTPACASTSHLRAAADLAPDPGGTHIVLAAVRDAADAITGIGTADQQAVRTAAEEGRLYLPTRLMPEGYDIPRRYTRAPRPRADTLLATYVTAISVSTLVTEVLDDLAATIDAPNTVLGAHRNFENPQPGARRHERDRRAEPAAAPGALPQAAQIESLLHSLQITEPAMLLRAVAIDQAGNDLLAEASAKSRSRDRLAVSPAEPVRQARSRAVNVASEDMPRRIPDRDQQPSRYDERTPALPATAAAARRTTRLRGPGMSRPR